MNEETKKIIQDIAEVPAMPNIVVKALELVKNPHSSIKDLGEIISYDQALSLKVLNIVNSAYYGFAQQITSIHKALALLGMNKTKSIIIAVAMKPMFSTEKNKQLWEHSITTAVGCEFLAEHFNRPDIDETFTIGFMHDIGKTIINKQDPELLAKVAELVRDGSDIIEAEDAFFGTNHSEIGTELAKKWQLSTLLASVIKYHHNPIKSTTPIECALVYLVNKLVQPHFKDSNINYDYIKCLNIKLDRPDILRQSILNRANILISDISK